LPLFRLLRLAVAIGLTVFVFWKAHPSEVLRAAAGADLRWIALAIGLVLVDRTLMALRWLDLLTALTPGSGVRIPIVVRIFFVSSFVSNFVPSVAADMYRAYALARHDVRLAESTASVLMDRVLVVLSMLLVGICALPLARGIAIPRAVVFGLALASIGCAAAAIVVFSDRAGVAILRGLEFVPVGAVRRATAALTEAVRRYASRRAALVRVLAMSVIVQGLRVLQAWCLGEALGIELSLLTYLVLIPVILMIMQLPLTPNGIGTTQVAFVAFFGASGLAAAPATALSVLFLVLGVIGSLPGGVLYAFDPATEPPGAPIS
jgi:uncharacterized protein (TIRG00374 family)